MILIDTNVLLNYITNREDPFLKESIQVVKKCANGECVGYIAFHTLSTLWYVLRKKTDEQRRNILKDICEIFEVASASKEAIIYAIEKKEFSDFEDCLQDQCAKEVNADFIVTCNLDDYKHSDVPAITPKEFLVVMQGL